jgi:uncharacterized protein (TIGR03086 family)
MDEIALHERALEETARLIAGVRADQLGLPTPCQDWDVRTLLTHLVEGNRRFIRLAEGEQIVGAPPEPVSGDYADSYRESGKSLAEAWRVPGRLDQLYRLPVGELPGRAVLSLRLAELTGHGWDLARATGQQPEFGEEVVAAAIRFAQAQMPADRQGMPFAPATPAPSDASDLDRLAAFLGRTV